MAQGIKTKTKWFRFEYKKPRVISHEDFSHVQFYYSQYPNSENSRRILIILDFIPTEDLKSGKILSGASGELFSSLNMLAEKNLNEAGYDDSLSYHTVCIVSYPYYKTFGKSNDYKESANRDFLERTKAIIARFKPDDVMVFGTDPYIQLAPNALELSKNYTHNWYGVPYANSITYAEKEYKFNIYLNVSLHHIMSDDGTCNNSSLIGYTARNLQNIIHGDLTYRVPDLKYKTILVDTIAKFDKMLKYLRNKADVAVDTETSNLNKIKNKLLILQFASSSKEAFIIPIYHKDTPFSPKELGHIKAKLKDYFEFDNNNENHLYANGSFDLNVLRANLDIRYFKNNIWDIFAAEFAFDENFKFVDSLRKAGYPKTYYYSLLNISMQYGYTGYHTLAFGKENRKVLSTVDLTEDLIEYCAVDVVILHGIKEQQVKRSDDHRYEKYKNMVSHIGDIIHFISTLENNGYKTDLSYLFSLRFEHSPLMLELKELREKLLASKGVAKVNTMLRKANNADNMGLFGQPTNIFSERKEDHLQKLFFEALRLTPTGITKKGGGQLDKKFQAKYSHVPEVNLLGEINKVKKLINTYVKGFIKKYDTDDDMRSDGRIRPVFNYLGVVTGRLSASNPSLHQIPSRGTRSRAIKRILIADPNRIIIKIDYNAHEVRGWCLISKDEKLADLFRVGINLRKKFRYTPTDELREELALRGDVHKINASYFFKKEIAEVTKPVRNAIKTVVFGLIYQQGFNGLARSTGLEKTEVMRLTKEFLGKYDIGANWIENIKKKARKLFYVESPIGRRRHLWSFLLPKGAENADSVHARSERLSVNSPVQGGGSDSLVQGSRCLETRKYKHFKETGYYPDFYQANSVHDSISVSCAIEDFWLAVGMIEKALTTDVEKLNKEKYGFDFIIPLEIDYEIGPNEADLIEWDFDLKNIRRIMQNNYKVQKEDMLYETSWDIYEPILKPHKDMPEWAKAQVAHHKSQKLDGERYANKK